jgi:hypothetical protein
MTNIDVVLVSLIAACVAFPCNAEDAMCEQIQRFASAQKDGLPHSVELLTDWGGIYSDKDVIASKQCLHSNYAPGKILCDYLLVNTSTEFAQANLFRALQCISNSPYQSQNDVLPEFLHVRFFSSSVPGVPDDVGVTLELNSDRNGPPSLKITTERFGE